MRITVEMKSRHRRALMALAGHRGKKDFSALVTEAIEEYLDGGRIRVRRRNELLSLAGSLSIQDAKHLRNTAMPLRENWR
jgi:hypothetical protein